MGRWGGMRVGLKRERSRGRRVEKLNCSHLLRLLSSVVSSRGIVQHFEIHCLLGQMDVANHRAANETVVDGGLRRKGRGQQCRQRPGEATERKASEPGFAWPRSGHHTAMSGCRGSSMLILRRTNRRLWIRRAISPRQIHRPSQIVRLLQQNVRPRVVHLRLFVRPRPAPPVRASCACVCVF